MSEAKCQYCHGQCCCLDKREGTIRYALLLPHGQGVHWCRHCVDGTACTDDADQEQT